MKIKMIKSPDRWVLCPICGNKTRTKIRPDTILENFPLFCPKCKQETLISAKDLNVGFFTLYEPYPHNAENIMYSLLDQGNNPTRVQLEEVLITDGLQRSQKRIAVVYNYDHMDEYLREWKLRREQVLNHTITVEEYTEWVVNWPDTSDVFVDEPNYRDWKKTEE